MPQPMRPHAVKALARLTNREAKPPRRVLGVPEQVIALPGGARELDRRGRALRVLEAQRRLRTKPRARRVDRNERISLRRLDLAFSASRVRRGREDEHLVDDAGRPVGAYMRRLC